MWVVLGIIAFCVGIGAIALVVIDNDNLCHGDYIPEEEKKND